MMQDPGDLASAPVLPPRPNPGPEPWPDQSISAWWFSLLALPVLAVAGWRYARHSAMTRSHAHLTEAEASPEAGSPAETLAHLASAVRDRLSRRFGSSFAAMTTEEVEIALSTLEPDFPREPAEKILRAADLAKFAAADVTLDHLAEAESWAVPVFAACSAGANSKITGR